MNDLHEAERQYEQALIDLKQATDSRGLKIMLGPHIKFTGDNPLQQGKMPRARDYGLYLKEFLAYVVDSSLFLDSESNFARNCRLLACAYEAAARYEEIKARG